jgi:uncharacterized protein YjgD (DUF1641 family)
MSEKNMENKTLKIEPHTMEYMVEIIDSFGLIMTFLNDQAVQDLSGMISQILKLLNGLSSSDLIDILERSLMDPELDKALIKPPKMGLLQIMRALGDEDTQKGIGILLTVVKALGKASSI